MTGIDAELQDYRAKQAARATACFVLAGVTALPGLLLAIAGWSESDQASRNAGVLLAAVGLVSVIPGARLLYLRRHRPTPQQELRGHVRSRLTIGSLGLVMGAGAVTGMVYFGSLVGDQPFDPTGFFAYAAVAGMSIPVGIQLIVVTLRHVRRLRRLAAQPAGTGTRLPLVGVDLGDDDQPVVNIDGPQGVVVLRLVPRQKLSELVGADGLTEVLGDPVPGGTVLLRSRTGDPVWPAARAKAG